MSRGATPRPPFWLVAPATLVAGATVLPLVYLVLRTLEAGPAAWHLLLRPRTATVVVNSLLLAAAVTVAAVAIGVPLAWLTTRSDLPFRRVWAVLTLMPLVIPSYVGSFAIVSAFGPRGILQKWLEPLFGVERLPEIYGFFGAWLTLTLFTYPYVLLSVRGMLLRMDPDLEAAARSLGWGPVATFFRVTLPLLRPAILAGGLLVAMYVLSDFGAVTMLQYETFTRAIYVQYQASLDRALAASLSLVLVAITTLLLVGESYLRGRARYARVGTGVGRPVTVVRLGRWRWAALAFCGLVVCLALVVPVAVVVHWLVRGLAAGEPLQLVWRPLLNSVTVSAAAAGVSVAAALPIALLSVRYQGRLARFLEKAVYLGHALPGIVVALSLVFFGIRYATPLYQTTALLVLAYVVLFLPQAVGAVQASLRQVNPHLEEAARTLGRRPLEVVREVTGPLVLPGLFAGFALVFLTAMKELPATLLLSPIGFKTLATQVWSATAEAFFARAAAPMLVLILASGLSLALVLEREPSLGRTGRSAATWRRPEWTEPELTPPGPTG
ncbi:MAG: iron ABC transporter permease [Firmicutes bacterium]|nr:iron ABC transporter permease [Bacillota bacterium]